MAADAGERREGLSVRIVSPERVVFEGRARAVVAPAWDGQLGILRGHAPLITLLGSGEVRVLHPAHGGTSAEDRYPVSGGVLEVDQNTVTVLSERTGGSGDGDDGDGGGA